MSLSEVKENKEALISGINGDTRFISRITSIGLTPGCRVRVGSCSLFLIVGLLQPKKVFKKKLAKSIEE